MGKQVVYERVGEHQVYLVAKRDSGFEAVYYDPRETKRFYKRVGAHAFQTEEAARKALSAYVRSVGKGAFTKHVVETEETWQSGQ